MGVGWGQQKKRERAKQRKVSKGEKKPKKPFEGLTRKPVCEQCAAEAERQEREVKREPPPKIERKRGRRQEINTRKQFCPEKECGYYGWLDRGNIISNGHPSGGRWRQMKCVVCGKHFQETIGTIFYGSSVTTEDIMRAIATLCEGVNPRKVARIFEVTHRFPWGNSNWQVFQTDASGFEGSGTTICGRFPAKPWPEAHRWWFLC
jgi:hypothetical protein